MRTLISISGEPLGIPDAERLVHLQFRRFAGCPVCNLHLKSFARRHDELVSASILEVAVFHSDAEALRKYEGDLPFAVVADPDKKLYVEYGVEASPRALLDPRAWLPLLRAIAYTVGAGLRRSWPAPPLRPQHGRFGLPADFLIASDGRVLASKHGEHLDDQWSVDELLALVPPKRE